MHEIIGARGRNISRRFNVFVSLEQHCLPCILWSVQTARLTCCAAFALISPFPSNTGCVIKETIHPEQHIRGSLQLA